MVTIKYLAVTFLFTTAMIEVMKSGGITSDNWQFYAIYFLQLFYGIYMYFVHYMDLFKKETKEELQ